MAMVCLLDIVVEAFDLAPNWKRRQLIVLDSILRMIYGHSGLWYDEVYKKAFKKENIKEEVSSEELYEEYLLIIEKYKNTNLYQLLKNNKEQRSLAQHELSIQRCRHILPYFYGSKIFLILFWWFGKSCILDHYYEAIAWSFRFITDNIAFFFTASENLGTKAA